jgi:general secretion pathway protein D
LGVEGFFQYDGVGNRSEVETDFGVVGQTLGGFARIIEDDLSVTLRALAEVGKLEILSRPSILVRNNELGVITIGQEVPFIRNSRVTQDGQTINTVEYEDIGIILEVTPRISKDKMVEMLIIPEISTLTGETVPISSGIDAPVFAKRSAETRVVVPDRHTVVIGGLMEDQKTETTRKVPLLGDIPLVGLAFRRKITTESKTELLIFLTPHVVENIGELDGMSASERSDTILAPNVFTSDQIDRFIGDLGTTSKDRSERIEKPAPDRKSKGNKGTLYRAPGRRGHTSTPR